MSSRNIFNTIYTEVIYMIKITLEQTLSERNVTRYELAKRTGIQYHIIDKYYKNKVIRYDAYVLDRICSALGCTISDFILYEE